MRNRDGDTQCDWCGTVLDLAPPSRGRPRNGDFCGPVCQKFAMQDDRLANYIASAEASIRRAAAARAALRR